jgi:hypothetical protein
MKMQPATATPNRQRKPRPKPARSVRLEKTPTEQESGVIIITVGKEQFPYFLDPIASDYGRSFCLSKFDGTSYNVNLGDNDGPPSCECPGFLRWGHRGPCKHLACLHALTERGLI